MHKIFLILAFYSVEAFSHNVATKSETVLTSLDQAKALGGVILSKDESTNTAVAFLTQLQIDQLSRLNHAQGKCAGFETLSDSEAKTPGALIENLKQTHLRIRNLGLLHAATTLT